MLRFVLWSALIASLVCITAKAIIDVTDTKPPVIYKAYEENVGDRRDVEPRKVRAIEVLVYVLTEEPAKKSKKKKD
jgi:hypothetical protein